MINVISVRKQAPDAVGQEMLLLIPLLEEPGENKVIHNPSQLKEVSK